MKVLIIYPNKEVITGGQAYDHYVIDRIITSPNHVVDFLTDDMLCSKSKFFYNFAYLNKFLWVKKYDIILTNSRLYSRLILLWVFIKMFSKIKMISFHHHFNFQGEENLIKRVLHKFLELSFLRISNATIIPSPYVKQLFQKFLPNKKVLYLELGINKSTLHNQKIDKKENNLLFVGSIEKRKGLVYLIKALKLLNEEGLNFHCNIVGKVIEENCFSTLKTNVNEFGLQNKVSFCGRVNQEQLATYYKEAICFVFPSLLEGYGMVLLEAMSYGLPIVAFDNSAMPYTVKNNVNGFLIENKNVEDFKTSIIKIITDSNLKASLSKGAFETYTQCRGLENLTSEIDLLIQHNFELVEI